jgi:hypothetical protein
MNEKITIEQKLTLPDLSPFASKKFDGRNLMGLMAAASTTVAPPKRPIH